MLRVGSLHCIAQNLVALRACDFAEKEGLVHKTTSADGGVSSAFVIFLNIDHENNPYRRQS